jgi:hypothetical protein
VRTVHGELRGPVPVAAERFPRRGVEALVGQPSIVLEIIAALGIRDRWQRGQVRLDRVYSVGFPLARSRCKDLCCSPVVPAVFAENSRSDRG